jgi:hypothetical protein
MPPRASLAAFSSATGEISVAVTAQPCSASQTALRPSPSATDSTVMPAPKRSAWPARKRLGAVPNR